MADDKKTVVKGPQRGKAVVDLSIIKPERVEALRKKAFEKVEKERLAAAEAQLLEQFENEERQAGGLVEPKVDIVIDLAPYADRIMLDSVIYMHGRTYTVRESVASVMLEMQQATWRHQSIVDGKPEDFYRKSRGQAVTPGGVTTSNILRA